MTREIGRRLATALPTLLLVVVMVFFLQELVPGDPAATVAGEGAPAEIIAETRMRLGLDRPMPERLAEHISDTATFDFGTSLQSELPVRRVITDALPVTASLALAALLLSVAIGVPAGVIAALRRRRAADRLVIIGSALALAIPPFVVALFLQIQLAIRWELFPATGYSPLAEGMTNWARNLILPAFTLSLGASAELARQVRAALADVLEQDYIRALRARGLPARLVFARHALRNAAGPAVTVLGLQVGRIIGAAVIVEAVFAMPGVGQLGVVAIQTHDYPVIRALVLLGAFITIGVNVLADLVNWALVPRSRDVA